MPARRNSKQSFFVISPPRHQPSSSTSPHSSTTTYRKCLSYISMHKDQSSSQFSTQKSVELSRDHRYEKRIQSPTRKQPAPETIQVDDDRERDDKRSREAISCFGDGLLER
jgi:hypothetical protein